MALSMLYTTVLARPLARVCLLNEGDIERKVYRLVQGFNLVTG
jgi:hypothetical protein